MAGFICVVAGTAWPIVASPASGAAPPDPYCTGSYGGAPPRTGVPVRFGIDAGLAGSAGSVQLPSTPDDPAKDLAAVRALRPPGTVLVVRLNRLFWSDGQGGIDAFQRQAARYTRAGFEVEVQVRYHPPPGQAGNIHSWVEYVRHVVDSLGADRRVVDMTITNEVNITFSPNTSDGAYPGAKNALIAGIEAAHAEALARGFKQLRFGFTYAYRFSPEGDAAFFSYLGQHGGPAFLRALGFVGVDFYPGTIYPPVLTSPDGYRAALAQAAGVVRECLARKAGIARSVPLWFTEIGVPTGALSEAAQAAGLVQLTRAACEYAGTFNITDYRWFNLRDNGPQAASPLSFSTSGLLRSDYRPKSSYPAYRRQISACGERARRVGPHPRRGHRRESLSFTG
jgi:hypothetical protein